MRVININNEKRLLRKCRQGDRQAQMLLYKKYARAMYRVSRNIVKDDMRAEEAMQDAFLAAFSKLSQFSGHVTFGAWLKKIVINRSLDELKKDKMYTYTIPVDNLQTAPNVPTNPLRLEDKIEAVKQAMDDLPENYRVIFSLYYLEGYDHEEIAQIMEVSSANSRVLLHRAKQKLMSLLN